MSERTKLFSKYRSKALWLMALTLGVALFFAGSAMTQTKQAGKTAPAPVTKQTKPAPAPKQAGQIVKVTITYTSGASPSISVSPDPVEIRANDEVKWECTGGCDFHVVFPNPRRKPFKSQHFDKGNSQSEKPAHVPPPGQTKKYKYTVVVGDSAIDPDVIIKGG
jgi:hypothetical protein